MLIDPEQFISEELARIERDITALLRTLVLKHFPNAEFPRADKTEIHKDFVVLCGQH